ncbi:hypothetical protein, partial [Bacillus paramycoides]|nr:hypothetical protein [Bacillus paramycoides]MED1564752.1 hypothetical protein [Bacillus paramycoides]
ILLIRACFGIQGFSPFNKNKRVEDLRTFVLNKKISDFTHLYTTIKENIPYENALQFDIFKRAAIWQVADRS